MGCLKIFRLKGKITKVGGGALYALVKGLMIKYFDFQSWLRRATVYMNRFLANSVTLFLINLDGKVEIGSPQLFGRLDKKVYYENL